MIVELKLLSGFGLDGDGFRNVDEVVRVIRNIFERETPGSNWFIRQMFLCQSDRLQVVLVGAALKMLFHTYCFGRTGLQ